MTEMTVDRGGNGRSRGRVCSCTSQFLVKSGMDCVQKVTTYNEGTQVILIEQLHVLRCHLLGLERLKTEEVG